MRYIAAHMPREYTQYTFAYNIVYLLSYSVGAEALLAFPI